MPDTEQTKDKNAPTPLQALGAGTITGLLAWIIIFSIVEHPPTSIEYIQEMFTSGALPYFFSVVIACIIGAFTGRATGKSYKMLWNGAIIGLVVSVILMVIRVIVFCCQ